MEYIPYKGKNKEDLWLYLDELERLDLDKHAHTDIFDVMEEISLEISGLRRLVERYSNSYSIYVFSHLAAAISHFAREATRIGRLDADVLDEIAELTFKMWRDVRWLTAQPHNLGALLSTIQMLVWSGEWSKSIVPDTFAEILQRCLRFGWIHEGKAQMLQIDALRLLNTMCKKNIIESSFNTEQIKWLRDEVHRIATLNVETNIMAKGLYEEGLEFLNCLDKHQIL